MKWKPLATSVAAAKEATTTHRKWAVVAGGAAATAELCARIGRMGGGRAARGALGGSDRAIVSSKFLLVNNNLNKCRWPRHPGGAGLLAYCSTQHVVKKSLV